ncbi:MAG: hypothetical protein PHP34_10780 [Bacteroidales bacterium]|nr:hypothetical protein [Bacteroidales bacterium]MDD4713803.1 hypothetical protein [Bacteroidales bacterium]MEA4839942.1 hypothetical protein [Bacteroidales bacterium]
MDFDAFYKDLEEELLKLVKKSFKKYRIAAQKDVTEYLRLSKGRLRDYTQLVSLQKITPEEQEFLTQALKQNALLYSLKESGRAAVGMKRFAESMVSVTLEVALAYAVKML